MNEPVFKTVQLQFAAHLRDPAANPAPADVEDRRMGIYRDLIYKNIEGFISGGFPILRQLLDDRAWHGMVRDFVSRHVSHSPYFLEISQEFLKYLQEERQPQPADPPFMLELAHYEWVELALDVSTEQLPGGAPQAVTDYLAARPRVSPLAWCLSYQYPVHRIGPDYQPRQPPAQPTFLIVYRNAADQVKFMESNAVTVRLLSILEEPLTGDAALAQLAAEMQHPDPGALKAAGQELLAKLHRAEIVYF
ncbi:DNA-binding domain-containing protein [Exilibacterium tricleocarpae]|uniref:HvfC family RiPP maturation protein n=1 Tax=Exilibacterium tricleocarpae TaxID=2591008 RepID=UPI001FE37CCF|nr:putative DNA-binding domain-containing protein [Exilibacterium tricleocarpae]